MSQTPAQIDTVISSSPSADMNDVDQDHELSAEEESDISDDEPAGASPSDRVRRNLRDDKSNMTQLNGDDESINAAGLGPFDWQDFEQRFEDEMAQAEAKEQEISQEFGDLVQVSASNFPSRSYSYNSVVFSSLVGSIGTSRQ